MKKLNRLIYNTSGTLRQKAEEVLKTRRLEKIGPLSETDILKLLHELEVHQLELEMQNDELLLANEQISKAAGNRYRELFDFSPSGYLILSSEGEIIEINPAGSQLLGKERKKLIKNRFGFFVSDNTRAIYNFFLDDIFRSKGKKTCELILNLDNHLSLDVQLDGIVTENGKECLVTMTDITIQKRAVEKVRESEIFLKSAQTVAGFGTFSVRLDLKSWESSEILDQIFGINSDFDKSYRGWMAIIHPGWRQVMGDYFHRLAESNNPIFDKEYKIIRQNDLAERWIHTKGRIEFESSNNPRLILGVITDITDRKLMEEKLIESEKLYQALISNLNVGLLVQGAHSEILLSNSRALELLGLTQDQLLGKTSFDEDWNVIHEDGSPYPGTTHPVPLSIETHKPIRNAVMGVFRPESNDRVWLLVNADPELNPDGSVNKVNCTFTDITERKLTEEALQAKEQQYRDIFHKNTAVKLIINPFTGNITKANQASAIYYGYTIPELESMKIDDINILSSKQIRDEMAMATFEQRNYFNFRHRLASGEIRDVEVYSGPIESGGKILLYSIIHDITKRKQAEYLLQNSLDRLLKIASRVPGVVYEYKLKPDGTSYFPFASEAIKEIYQVTPDEVRESGSKVFEKILPEDLAGVIASIQESAIELKPWKYEYRVKFDDGSVHTLYGNAVPQAEMDGSILWHGYISDISERKEVETKLQISESRFRAILDNSYEAIGVHINGIWAMCNPAAVKLFGVNNQEELLGTPLINVITPDERPRILYYVQDRNKDSTSPSSYVTRGLRKDGTEFDMDVKLSTYMLENKRHVMVILRDITKLNQARKELHESEERLRTIVEWSSNGIVVHRDGRIVFVNPAAVKMFGANSETELIGTGIFDRIHPNYHQIVTERLAKARDEKIGAPRIEIKYLKLNGEIIDAEVQGNLINYDGIPSFQVSINDITDRKRAEDELKRVNTEKDKFFSIIAHDLRSPFSGFLGLTEIMAKELAHMSMDEVMQISVMMNKSAINLYNLLGNLLEWSKMQRGLTAFVPQSTELRSKVIESLVLSLEAARKKEIDIAIDLSADWLTFVDPYMFECIIRNLTNNAIKFTPKGGKIKIAATTIDKNLIEVSVNDTGIGMNTQMIKDLFQLNINTNRKGTMGELSTGLGLIICKDFVEKQGGKLWVESEVGVGSTFRFTLPVFLG